MTVSVAGFFKIKPPLCQGCILLEINCENYLTFQSAASTDRLGHGNLGSLSEANYEFGEWLPVDSGPQKRDTAAVAQQRSSDAGFYEEQVSRYGCSLYRA
jgi:hypothetical protein